MIAVAAGLTVCLNIIVLEAGPSHQNGQVILIQFRPEASEAERLQTIRALGGELTEWLTPLHIARVSLIEPNQSAEDFVDAAALHQDHPSIYFLETDDLVVSGTFTPSDPDFADPNRSYAQRLVGLPSAWDFTTGISDVVIAVLDTGIAFSHTEFISRTVPGYDFVNQDDDPFDDHGHGSHVAGIIAANINNGAGTVGVCPSCRIMPIKVLDENNLGAWSSIALGILYAVDHDADVINLSLGSTQSSQTVKNALEYARSHGVVIVAAAGNQAGSNPFYPAAYPEVIAVTAIDRYENRWGLSNYGSFIDLAAPGDDIYSTGSVDTNPPNGYSAMGGTSMAAPFVAGLAGLLLSQEPTRTITDVFGVMQRTAVDLGEPGQDPLFGYGRIDAARALAEIEGSSPPPPPVAMVYLPVVRR